MQQESEKEIWKSWFWIKIFTTRQTLKWKIYDASDSKEKIVFEKLDFEEKRNF